MHQAGSDLPRPIHGGDQLVFLGGIYIQFGLERRTVIIGGVMVCRLHAWKVSHF
jgi:hypothetical protein